MLHSLPDVIGTGVAVQLSSSGTPARAIQISMVSNSSGSAARVGDAEVSSTRGIPVFVSGGQILLPPIPDMPGPFYTLAGTYVWIGSGDHISVAYWD